MQTPSLSYQESWSRSAIKSFSWRALATLTTVTLVYLLTEKVELAMAAGTLEMSIKMVLYFVHERAWDRVNFGKKALPSGVIWLTGLSGSGKTTIAEALAKEMRRQGFRVDWLDGDVTRNILPQTGFSKKERDAHVLKAGFIAKTLENNGIFAIASYISPYRETRDRVRAMCRNFIEVHVATPLDTCEERDVKGLYAKARRGEIRQFTGIDDPYEAPKQPEMVVDTRRESVDQAVTRILRCVKQL
ncbi:Adenylyl-sulfate kinase [Sulfidibacter corallicola]|uniref:Adenylyl-sulfate kinase n=1 Tax=Sulfidibacter corallicola TaxID=2818388 RepID=A0A8A4TKI4_SULCO|nr:adenylyl-sulfate kinase [Sulfidibacter corallicola]QTD50093.1 adenylyl-sulfate kinase [Sulfidibacter corallicola]